MLSHQFFYKKLYLIERRVTKQKMKVSFDSRPQRQAIWFLSSRHPFNSCLSYLWSDVYILFNQPSADSIYMVN